MLTATVVCDASFWECRERGLRAAGWAAWVRVDGVPYALQNGGQLRAAPECSASAELYAAMNGIFMARRMGALSVLIRSDCLAVVNLINKGRTPSARLQALFLACAAHPVITGGRYRAVHVKAHTAGLKRAEWVNNWCDDTARKHMARQRKKAVREFKHGRRGAASDQGDRQGV